MRSLSRPVGLNTRPHFSDKNLKICPVSGLVLLQLLLPLSELALGVADIAAEAVAVEVVVAARLGERLALLDKKATKRGSSAAWPCSALHIFGQWGEQSKWWSVVNKVSRLLTLKAYRQMTQFP